MLRKKVALLLAVLMVLTAIPTPVFAEEQVPQDVIETVAEQKEEAPEAVKEALEEETPAAEKEEKSEKAEEVKAETKTETKAEEKTDVKSEETKAEEKTEIPEGMELITLSQRVKVPGQDVWVAIKDGEFIVPKGEDIELTASLVENEKTIEKVQEAIKDEETIIEREQPLEKTSYTFDVKIVGTKVNEGKEYQPINPAAVSFDFNEQIKSEAVDVYHVHEEGKALEASLIESTGELAIPTSEEVEEIGVEAAKEIVAATETATAVRSDAEIDYSVLDGAVDDDVNEGTTVDVEANGFSYYVIEFVHSVAYVATLSQNVNKTFYDLLLSWGIPADVYGITGHLEQDNVKYDSAHITTVNSYSDNPGAASPEDRHDSRKNYIKFTPTSADPSIPDDVYLAIRYTYGSVPNTVYAKVNFVKTPDLRNLTVGTQHVGSSEWGYGSADGAWQFFPKDAVNPDTKEVYKKDTLIIRDDISGHAIYGYWDRISDPDVSYYVPGIISVNAIPKTIDHCEWDKNSDLEKNIHRYYTGSDATFNKTVGRSITDLDIIIDGDVKIDPDMVDGYAYGIYSNGADITIKKPKNAPKDANKDYELSINARPGGAKTDCNVALYVDGKLAIDSVKLNASSHAYDPALYIVYANNITFSNVEAVIKFEKSKNNGPADAIGVYSKGSIDVTNSNITVDASSIQRCSVKAVKTGTSLNVNSASNLTAIASATGYTSDTIAYGIEANTVNNSGNIYLDVRAYVQNSATETKAYGIYAIDSIDNDKGGVITIQQVKANTKDLSGNIEAIGLKTEDFTNYGDIAIAKNTVHAIGNSSYAYGIYTSGLMSVLDGTIQIDGTSDASYRAVAIKADGGYLQTGEDAVVNVTGSTEKAGEAIGIEVTDGNDDYAIKVTAGSLNATGSEAAATSESYGLYAKNKKIAIEPEVDGLIVNVNGGIAENACGISAGSGLSVTGDAFVNAYADGSVTSCGVNASLIGISDNAVLNLDVTGEGVAKGASATSITLENDAVINAEAGDGAEAYGIYADNLSLVDNAVVNATASQASTKAAGIKVTSSMVAIEDTQINAYADWISDEKSAGIWFTSVDGGGYAENVEIGGKAVVTAFCPKGENEGQAFNAAIRAASVKYTGFVEWGNKPFDTSNQVEPTNTEKKDVYVDHPYAKIYRDSHYRLWVGEQQVSESNKDKIRSNSFSAGYASYEPSTNTLTLHGVVYKGYGEIKNQSIFGGVINAAMEEPLTIVLEGDNDFTIMKRYMEPYYSTVYAIESESALTITSDPYNSGSLAIHMTGLTSNPATDKFEGIHAADKYNTGHSLVIEGASVTIEGTDGNVSRGIDVAENFEITQDGSIDISGFKYGVYVPNGTVKADADHFGARGVKYGVYDPDYPIDITANTMNIGGQYGIYSEKAITVNVAKATISEATASDTYGIWSEKDAVTLSGGDYVISGYSDGVNAYTDLIANVDSIDATVGKQGLVAETGNINIDATGSVAINCAGNNNSSGIYAKKGNILIGVDGSDGINDLDIEDAWNGVYAKGYVNVFADNVTLKNITGYGNGFCSETSNILVDCTSDDGELNIDNCGYAFWVKNNGTITVTDFSNVEMKDIQSCAFGGPAYDITVEDCAGTIAAADGASAKGFDAEDSVIFKNSQIEMSKFTTGIRTKDVDIKDDVVVEITEGMYGINATGKIIVNTTKDDEVALNINVSNVAVNGLLELTSGQVTVYGGNQAMNQKADPTLRKTNEYIILRSDDTAELTNKDIIQSKFADFETAEPDYYEKKHVHFEKGSVMEYAGSNYAYNKFATASSARATSSVYDAVMYPQIATTSQYFNTIKAEFKAVDNTRYTQILWGTADLGTNYPAKYDTYATYRANTGTEYPLATQNQTWGSTLDYGQDYKLYAVWEHTTNSVSFTPDKTNQGTHGNKVVPTNTYSTYMVIKQGQKVSEIPQYPLTAPVAKGYIFDGYYAGGDKVMTSDMKLVPDGTDDATFEQKATNVTYSEYYDYREFTGKWTAKTIEVVWNVNGGSCAATPGETTDYIKYDAKTADYLSIARHMPYSRQNYTFNGFIYNGTVIIDRYGNPTSTYWNIDEPIVTLTASYTYKGNGGGTGGGGGSTGGGGGGGGFIVSSGTTQTSYVTGTWSKNGKGQWTFTLPNGVAAVNCWQRIYVASAPVGDQVNWYRFNADGTLATGWYTDTDGKTYYLEPSDPTLIGAMVTGWRQIGDKWYYFGTDGALYRNTTTPDGYKVGADGAWIK